MKSRLLQGDVFDMLPTIEPGSVDCAITSPPYWMLRSYLPKGHALKHLELGSEPTPAKYVENMVRVFRLVREAMADHATLWLNVGDSYFGSWGNYGGHNRGKGSQRPNVNGSLPSPAYDDRADEIPGTANVPGIDAGNLCLIPQRLMIALQDDGWIIRSVIVWHKPAPMPSSVQGWSWRKCRVKVKGRPDKHKGHERPQAAHAENGKDFAASEWSDCPGCPKCLPNGGLVLRRGSWRPTSSWEPVIMLAKSAKYFCDGEAVKTQAAAATIDRNLYTRVANEDSKCFVIDDDEGGAAVRLGRDDRGAQFSVRHDHETLTTTANLRDVWTIAAEPLKERHYAAYPTKLVENCLRAGTSSKGYCPHCGGPWVRLIAETQEAKCRNVSPSKYAGGRDAENAGTWTAKYDEQTTRTVETLGFRPSCTCPPHEPRPGLVLDPFSGAGRTAETCLNLGLDFVGCELNPEYVKMSQKRLKEHAPLFV